MVSYHFLIKENNQIESRRAFSIKGPDYFVLKYSRVQFRTYAISIFI